MPMGILSGIPFSSNVPKNMKQKSITPNVPTRYMGRETIRENSRFSVCLRNVYKFLFDILLILNNKCKF